jgi:hypothetical protein
MTSPAHVVMMTFILYGTPPLCAAAQVIGGSILFVRECEGGGLYIMKYTFIIRWATAFKRRQREKRNVETDDDVARNRITAR